MTTQETNALLSSLAQIGAAIAAGTSPAGAATFALAAIIREAPHLFAIASILLANGKPTEEQLKASHDEAVALGDPASIPPAA